MDASNQQGYLHRLHTETPTRFWVNNATPDEAKSAIESGVLCATTNPTYLARMLQVDPDMPDLIRQVLEKSANIETASEMVYRSAVDRLRVLFEPVYRKSDGRYGYVAIQGDPRVNTDLHAILEEARRYREMGENIIVKVPSTPVGAAALEQLTREGCPTIATIGFSVDQAAYMAEAYQRATGRFKFEPPCYIVFITGILEAYLTDESERRGNVVAADHILQAGSAAARVIYREFKERGYDADLLVGGVVGTHSLTDLVGGDLSVTADWRLLEGLVEVDGPVVSDIQKSTPYDVLSALEEQLPDFCRAYRRHSLAPDEFREFGPCKRFQDLLEAKYQEFLDKIRAFSTEPTNCT